MDDIDIDIDSYRSVSPHHCRACEEELVKCPCCEKEKLCEACDWCEACHPDDEEHDDVDRADEDGFLIDRIGFADPGGTSALRAATKNNPRNLPCPTCREPNRLTPADKRAGYQCDACANRAENGGDW